MVLLTLVEGSHLRYESLSVGSELVAAEAMILHHLLRRRHYVVHLQLLVEELEVARYLSEALVLHEVDCLLLKIEQELKFTVAHLVEQLTLHLVLALHASWRDPELLALKLMCHYAGDVQVAVWTITLALA